MRKKKVIDSIVEIKTADLRQLCIKENWYTAGTVREYSEMFDKAEQCRGKFNDGFVFNLYQIAKDIFDHSNECFIGSEEFSTVEWIMALILENCGHPDFVIRES